MANNYTEITDDKLNELIKNKDVCPLSEDEITFLKSKNALDIRTATQYYMEKDENGNPIIKSFDTKVYFYDKELLRSYNQSK